MVAIIFYIVASSLTSFKNPFDQYTGFATLLFVWDFSTIIQVPETGAGLLLNWPQLINTPHVEAEAWVSYVFVPIALVSGIWYLVTVQAFIARGLQIKKLGQKIFGEQIENFTLNTNYGNGQITPPPANNPDTGEKK